MFFFDNQGFLSSNYADLKGTSSILVGRFGNLTFSRDDRSFTISLTRPPY